MNKKMTTCKACGQEIAKSAKACPHCGAKNKKPIFKKWWFWAIVVILIASLGTSGGDAENESAKVNIESVSTGTVINNENKADKAEVPAKTEYYVGEQLDVTGGSLLYKDANGNETEVALLSTMVSGFESDEVGTFELTITYKDATLKLNYKIKNYLEL